MSRESTAAKLARAATSRSRDDRIADAGAMIVQASARLAKAREQAAATSQELRRAEADLAAAYAEREAVERSASVSLVASITDADREAMHYLQLDLEATAQEIMTGRPVRGGAERIAQLMDAIRGLRALAMEADVLAAVERVRRDLRVRVRPRPSRETPEPAPAMAAVDD